MTETGILDATGKMVHDGDTVEMGTLRGVVELWDKRGGIWMVTIEHNDDDPPELRGGWTALTDWWRVVEGDE